MITNSSNQYQKKSIEKCGENINVDSLDFMCLFSGWAMQNALYIFLQRRWEQDESYLNTVLSYFVNSLDCLQLLLFPEGTNFEDASKVKSDSFAKKNSLPSYDYVLHPRVRGFTYCVEKLRQGRLDAIHDVTIGYSENYCYEEMDLLKGNVPDEIHFHLQRYSNEELPQDLQGLEEWCCKRWEEKEERLKTFYTRDKHFGPPPELASEVQITVRRLFMKDLIFWVLFIICMLVLMYTSVLVRWYVAITGAVFMVLSFCGGTDKIFLQTQKPSSVKSD